jgi:hypothetical protein
MIDNNWIEALITCACILVLLFIMGAIGLGLYTIFMFKSTPQPFVRVQVRKEYWNDKST